MICQVVNDNSDAQILPTHSLQKFANDVTLRPPALSLIPFNTQGPSPNTVKTKSAHHRLEKCKKNSMSTTLSDTGCRNALRCPRFLLFSAQIYTRRWSAHSFLRFNFISHFLLLTTSYSTSLLIYPQCRSPPPCLKRITAITLSSSCRFYVEVITHKAVSISPRLNCQSARTLITRQ